MSCIMSDEKLPAESAADKPHGKMYFRYDAEHIDELVDEIMIAWRAEYDRVIALQAKKKQNSDAPESKDER